MSEELSTNEFAMKKIITTIFLIQIAVSCLAVSAENNTTIPVYHWAYPYFHQLRLRGYLTGLNVIQQPYTFSQATNALANLRRQIQQGSLQPTRQDQWMIDLLAKEFQAEAISDSGAKLTMRTGVWADERIIHENRETRAYTQLRSQIGVSLGDRFHLYNGILMDQSLRDDPGYVGERWRGFAGYTEQAYLRYTGEYFDLTLGRDFMNWGSGKTGKLLFSNSAQPLDRLEISLKYKGLRFTSFAANLDQWQLSDSLARKHQVGKANRYLSGHRLTLNFRNRFYLGMTEALLYGGPNSTWELKYHNPLLYYHGELLNGGGFNGNGFLYLDFDWYPGRNWELYGEILIDDFQVEKTVPGDLEPDEIGIIFGVQRTDFFGLPGSLLGLEYVRVANRTYNSSFEWEKFVYFNRPLGYYLGNNFDRWNLVATYFPINKLQVGFGFDYIRQGTGSILNPWDTPWESYSVSEGYHEPFPYGQVERSWIANMNLTFHVRTNAIVESEIRYQNIVNEFHQSGSDRHDWSFDFRLHWNIGMNFYD